MKASIALAGLLVVCWTARLAAAGGVATNGFWLVDLSPLAIEGPAAREFPAPAKGVELFHDIPFRSSIPAAVAGIEAARAGDFFPPSIRGIPIGRAVRRLHLLHATSFADKDGTPLARLVFHYADGGEESVRLGYGVHARSWVTPRLEKRAALFDPNSREAWSEADNRRDSNLRLFQTALDNPRPAETITHLDVISLFSHAAPFIAALTVEGPESKLPPNRPASTRKPARDLLDSSDAVYRGELAIRVTDSETGAPVTNAVVSLSITDDKDSFYFGGTNTDAQGAARLPYPPLHAVGIGLWIHAPDRLPAVITESRTNVAQFAGTYSVALRRGATAGGLVKAPDGKPISGARIVIHQVARNSPHHYTRTDFDSVLTGADGRWTSRCLPEDLAGFSFRVTHPEFRSALYVTEGFAPPPTEGTPVINSSVSYRRMADGSLEPITKERRGLGPRGSAMPFLTTNALRAASAEMLLQPALLVQGTLSDATGKGLPSAELILQRLSGERRYLRTDAQGHFETRVEDRGDAALVVLREGFRPLWQTVNVTPSLPPLELRLAPARELKGRVQDRSGRPVSGARVRLDEWNDTSDLLKFQALTDEQGSFVWTGAPSDSVSLYVSKTNFSNTRNTVAGNAESVTITVSRPPGVYGKVYDAETKQPIESFSVVPGRKYSANETQIRWDRSEASRGYAGEYSLRMSSYYFQPEARVLVEATGYEPQVSRGFNGIDAYPCDFALKKGKGIAGVVLLPDGSPAAAAGLVIVERGENAYLDPLGQVRGSGGGADLSRADGKGRFEFMPKLDPDKIFVSHEQGFAEARVADVLKDGTITLQKWGRLKGLLRVGDKAGSDETVRLQKNYDPMPDPEGRGAGFSFSFKADPDSERRFVFDRVPPGEHRLALEYHFKDDRNGDVPWSHGFLVSVKPGETAEATLGGTGRRVNGRVKVQGGDSSDLDWRRDVHRLTLVLAQDAAAPAAPARGLGGVLVDFLGGHVARGQPMTPEAMRERQRAERIYVLLFDTNGVFHADNVPPGKYQLSLNVTDPEDEYYNRRIIGALSQEVFVPDDKTAKVNAPFDIGELELTIRARVKLGRMVPSFDAKTADGKTIKLSELRGKPVLLHFWGLSLGYSTFDMQLLKEFQNTYGQSGRLTILGCNLDADTQGAQQFAKTQGMTWTQTYLGQWNQTPIPGMFGLNGNSACVLIDSEGKLASGQLRGSAIRNAVANGLTLQ